MRLKNSAMIIFLYSFLFPLTSCLVPDDDGNIGETIIADSPRKEFIIPADFDFEGTLADWHDFSPAAASVTFDDGTYDQYAAAFPILEELGIKGTFYLAAHLIDRGAWNDGGTVRQMMSWSHAREIAAAGHEIGSHSMNHLDLTTSGVDLELELKGSRDFMEENLPGVNVETFCWPHWRENPEALAMASQYYLSGRSGNGLIEYYYKRKGGIPSNPPSDMYKVNALGILNSQKEEQWKGVFDDVLERGSWFVSSYHGVDNGTLSPGQVGWNPLSDTVFKETVLYPVRKGFWVETFAHVSKYIYQRDAAVLRISNKKYSIEMTLDDQLDDNVYDRKLSLRLNKPANWTSVLVLDHKGREVPYRTEGQSLIMDILPDGSVIEIKPY